MLSRVDVEEILARVEDKLKAAQANLDEVIALGFGDISRAVRTSTRDWWVSLREVCQMLLARMPLEETPEEELARLAGTDREKGAER